METLRRQMDAQEYGVSRLPNCTTSLKAWKHDLWILWPGDKFECIADREAKEVTSP